MQNILLDCTKMRFEYKNCTIILSDSRGRVYQNGKLMFMGDGYIAIKHLLLWTNNAEEVRERFKAQLSTREQCRWDKREAERNADQKIKEEAERAKESISKSQKNKSNKIKVSKYKLPFD